MLEPKTSIKRVVKWRGDVEDVPSTLSEDVDIAVEDETECGRRGRMGTYQDGGGAF